MEDCVREDNMRKKISSNNMFDESIYKFTNNVFSHASK